MAKLANWQTLLDWYITANHSKPFSYNSEDGLDCCTFTFGAIEAQIGRDIGAKFRGRYKSFKASLLLMQAYCGRPSLPLAISKLMDEQGFAIVDPFHAQRGDAVIAPNGPDYFLGVLHMNGTDVLSVGEHGVRRVPISIRCRAWRIE